MTGEPQLFVGDIDPKNIVEGYLGNSYFISAVRALAENPINIKSLFDIKKSTKEGQYFVNLCLNGENYKIEIDDYIPYCDKMNKPAFSRSKDKNELWVMLLEKAWAKVSGNYENSIGGLCCESFRALTGAPVEYINHTYIQEVWKQIYDAYHSGNIICAMAEKENLTSSNFDDTDLFSAYAYTIVKVHEFEADDGKIRLVKVRNPGSQKWLSMFSDTSKIWRDELKKSGNKPSDDEDCFLISIEDYLCYFRTTLICQTQAGSTASSLRCRQGFGETSLIRISLSEKERVSFTATQFNQKFVGRSTGKQPNFIRMIIGKERDSHEDDYKRFPIQFIDGKSGFEENLNITCNCEPGDYFAFIEIQGKKKLKSTNNFVFRAYCEDIPLMEEEKGKVVKDFLPNVLKSMAREVGDRKTYEDKGEPDIFRCLAIDEDKTKYGYLYYENNSKESTLKEEVAFEQLEGVIIQGHHGKKSVHIEVPPGENKLIVMDQIEKQYIMKCEYFTSIHKSMHDLKDLVKTKGERKQIKFDGKAHNIFYYVYDDGDGYIWMFENESEDIIFEGTFYYTLNNLKIADKEAKGGNEWKVKLNPGEKSYMRMDAVDITQSWGYKCKCSFHCLDDISTDDKIIQKALEQGEKQQVLYHGEHIDVFYYICFINDKYVWYFINKTDKKFSGTFKFYMENLKLADDHQERPRSKWDIFLEPGETCLKKMEQLDPYKNSKYECSYSCELV